MIIETTDSYIMILISSNNIKGVKNINKYF